MSVLFFYQLVCQFARRPLAGVRLRHAAAHERRIAPGAEWMRADCRGQASLPCRFPGKDRKSRAHGKAHFRAGLLHYSLDVLVRPKSDIYVCRRKRLLIAPLFLSINSTARSRAQGLFIAVIAVHCDIRCDALRYPWRFTVIFVAICRNIRCDLPLIFVAICRNIRCGLPRYSLRFAAIFVAICRNIRCGALRYRCFTVRLLFCSR